MRCFPFGPNMTCLQSIGLSSCPPLSNKLTVEAASGDKRKHETYRYPYALCVVSIEKM